MKRFAIAIHGGAGADPATGMTHRMKIEYHYALRQATNLGYAVLENGGTSLDAVEAALRSLEDCPLFNAGRGASFTETGFHELDAAIMCGRTLKAGAVAAVRRVKNPITLARAIMNSCKHLFIVGRGAEEIARDLKLEIMPDDYFYAEHKYIQWKREQSMEKQYHEVTDHGTAGAVALDKYGNLAAGTSTGGLSNKTEYRVSDSAIIGAGTYANNRSCAVSCSGTGEHFIRTVAAHEVASLMKYGRMNVKEACETVLNEELNRYRGDAGLMAMDPEGNIFYAHNTLRFYRGWRTSDGKMGTAIYRE